MRVLELFGGIGACTTALRRIGVDVEVADYVEIDKYAVASYNAINGTNFEPQDICAWDKNIEVDLIMHGSPCQDFSVAGKQAGGDVGSGTRSSLMYETIRIVGKLRPKYVVWENVKNLLSAKHRHNFDAYLETMKALGYVNYYQVLNAKDYGIPQNRERVFTISIRKDVDKGYEFPEKQLLEIRLKNILENEVDEKFYLSDTQVERMKTTNFECSKFEHRVCQEDSITPTLCARDWKDPKCVQVGTLDIKGMDCVKRVYSDEGLSPTLTDMQGGNRQPKIIDTNFSRYREYSEYSCAIDTYANKLKVIEEQPAIIIDDTQGFDGVRYYENSSPTLRAARNGLKTIDSDYRIRKLTPKECWRLMGFDDASFEKAAKVNSNTQLYKQAGNSICVPVLEAIFKKLLKQ